MKSIRRNLQSGWGLFDIPWFNYFDNITPGYKLDQENLARYWQQVGDYLRSAMKDMDKEIERAKNVK